MDPCHASHSHPAPLTASGRPSQHWGPWGSKAQRWPNPIPDKALDRPFLTSPRSVPRPFPGGFLAAFHAVFLMQSYFNAVLCILLLPLSVSGRCHARLKQPSWTCCARMGWVCCWKLGFMGHLWGGGGAEGWLWNPRVKLHKVFPGIRGNCHRACTPCCEQAPGAPASLGNSQLLFHCPDVPRCVWGLSQCPAGVTGELGPDFSLCHLPRGDF